MNAYEIMFFTGHDIIIILTQGYGVVLYRSHNHANKWFLECDCGCNYVPNFLREQDAIKKTGVSLLFEEDYYHVDELLGKHCFSSVDILKLVSDDKINEVAHHLFPDLHPDIQLRREGSKLRF